MPDYLKTAAFVIKTSEYSETSLIVTLFALEQGKIRCIAKGARRPKSQFAGKLEPFNQIEAVCIRGKSDLLTLKECSITRSRMGLRRDLPKINSAFQILSLLEETQTDGDSNPDVFRLVVDCLDAIEKSSDPRKVLLPFRIGLLVATGYAPDYYTCASCGGKLGKEVGYSSTRNGFLCPNCGKERGTFRISAGTVQILKRFQEAGLSAVKKIRLSAAQQEEAEKLMTRMYQSILERQPKADKILDSMA